MPFHLDHADDHVAPQSSSAAWSGGHSPTNYNGAGSSNGSSAAAMGRPPSTSPMWQGTDIVQPPNAVQVRCLGLLLHVAGLLKHSSILFTLRPVLLSDHVSA